MSKSAKAIVQIALALVLSLAAGLTAFMWTGSKKPVARPEAQIPGVVSIVVAAKDLKRGEVIDAASVKLAGQMSDSLPAGAFRDPAGVKGRVIAADVARNELLTETRLAPRDSGPGISAIIPPGKRAMAVKGNKVMGLAGFVRPGNRVDVLATLNTGQAEDKPVTKLVLENVPVLATGAETVQPPDGGKPSSVDVYTLELSPEESEKLALAANEGTLHFALRNSADQDSVLTSGADVAKTLASLRPAGRRAEPLRASGLSVEVITGASRAKVNF
ncbi:MAG: Flp pilus assembly protein CpaB [Desulfovibrionaceae bacterium]|nr:Flp pilus assembly protein CpaB [Desulfovibrionaceae bacterium]